MNARNPLKSIQLKAILNHLAEVGDKGATSWQLADVSGSLAVATCVSECRAGGFNITCTQEKTAAGRRVYRYRLIEAVYNK